MWRTYLFPLLFAIWLLSLILRFSPFLRRRYPRAQLWALAIGWTSMLGILLILLAGH